MSAQNPMNPQMGGAPPKKGISPLVIILIAVAGLFVLVGLLMVAGGLFVAHKAKQAGIDPGLMRDNPGLAIAKMAAAMDPNIEVVGVEEGSGRITLRQKDTGKTVTVSLDQIKQGKISWEEEGASGGGGAASPASGSFQFGASGGKLPDWIPTYPGAAVKGGMSGQSAEGRTGHVVVTTNDSAQKLMDYYSDALKRAGLEVSTVVRTHGDSEGGIVRGNTPDEKRSAMVLIGTNQDGTSAAITFQEK